MNPTIETRIHELYAELPARERRLADLLLDMRDDVAVYSATELAAQAGVSKATAARLFRRLGFVDFAEMRQQARAERQPGSPLDEIDAADPSLAAHIAQDMRNLTRTLEGLRSDTIAEAVGVLSRAERLWVVGFRNNHALALYVRGLLVQLKDDVRLLPVGGYTIAEDLAAISPRDAVLGLAFRRRLPAMERILRQSRDAGAKVILVTEPAADDCARHADVLLRCHSRGTALFDSYTAAVSVLNLLCSGVALALGAQARERLDRIEQLHDAFGDFGH